MINLDEQLKYMEGYSEEGDPKYKAIRELHELLDRNYISHSFRRHFDGYQISIYQGNKRVFSIIENYGSYGCDDDELELWSYDLESEGMDPIGYLTAYECLGIIKYFTLLSKEELSDHLEES